MTTHAGCETNEPKPSQKSTCTLPFPSFLSATGVKTTRFMHAFHGIHSQKRVRSANDHKAKQPTPPENTGHPSLDLQILIWQSVLAWKGNKHPPTLWCNSRFHRRSTGVVDVLLFHSSRHEPYTPKCENTLDGCLTIQPACIENGCVAVASCEQCMSRLAFPPAILQHTVTLSSLVGSAFVSTPGPEKLPILTPWTAL